MDYITIDTLRKLQSAGFTYPEYENTLYYGNMYYYHNDEYLVGGFCEASLSDLDKEVVQHGDWLPNATQLLAWLKNTDFKVCISIDDSSYHSIQATDKMNGMLYIGGDYTLANALAKVIFKICKSNRREYIPKPTLRVQIIDE